MSKIVHILQGLPGSGKSTLRKSMKLPYVNKDELRLENPEARESDIHDAQKKRIHALMSQGAEFIIDNTNFNPKTLAGYEGMAKQYGYDVQYHRLDVPIEECVRRDIERANPVGRDVIVGMALQWNILGEYERAKLKNVYIFDIDGTLADLTHRRGYLLETPKNWKEFNARIADDTLKEDVARMYRILERDNTLICVSGRIESEAGVNMRAITRSWLAKHGINPYVLLMRKARDHRADDIIKQEIYDTYIKGKMKVHGVFDDRDRVVKMWRSNGLTCFQVEEGNF